MSIRIIKKRDVHVTESEFVRYGDEYRKAYMHYAGTPPSLEDFIRSRQGEKSIRVSAAGCGS